MIRRFLSISSIRHLSSTESLVERSKKAAAYKAVDDNFPAGNNVVGIGSGTTVIYATERIGKLKDKESFVCIPTGFQAKQLIIDNGLRLGSIEQYPEVDVSFDGADEVDPKLNLIKGGGGCLFQEKLVASASKKFVVMADFRKRSLSNLGIQWRKGVPIEVVPTAYNKVISDLKTMGVREVNLRQGGSAKTGPVVTDNNNFLIDADFGDISDPAKLHADIKQLVGVVETGLFVQMADKAYFGEQSGEIKCWLK